MIYISFSQDSVSNNNCFSFDLVIYEQTCGCCLKCCVRVNLLCCGYSGRNMASEAEPFEIKPEDNSNGITDHSHEDKPGPHTAGGERSTVKESLNDNRERKAVYPCTDCEKRFLSRDSLRHHMISHRGKYKCTECGNVSNTAKASRTTRESTRERNRSNVLFVTSDSRRHTALWCTAESTAERNHIVATSAARHSVPLEN